MTRKHFLLAYAAAVPAGLALGHWLLGGPGVLAVGVAAILALAARFDNHTGSCLLIAVMVLVVIGMMLALLMVTAAMGGRG